MSATPHEAAWKEAHRLLASAEKIAAESEDPTALGAAVAEIDAAIRLLEKLRDTSNHAAPRRLLAAAWSLRARVRERVGSTEALDDAVHSLGKAVEQLRQTPDDADLQVRADLAVALHQHGNLRQQRKGKDDIRNAIIAYDEAITVLQGLPVDTAPSLRQALGAVWLNRGTAWVQIEDASAAAEALRSFDEAIATWRPLSPDAPPGQRINLAAAWMNRSHALLRGQEEGARADAVRTAASEAIITLGELEAAHVSAADIGIKARHITCRALGVQLAALDADATETRNELLGVATDVVDDGLALARRWIQRQARVPFAFVADFFRFGTKTYLTHQPHFLAEFVLEHLDPQHSADALPWHRDLDAIAEDVVTRALQNLERTHIVYVDTPDTDRRIQSLHDLRAALARLDALRAAAAPREG